MITTKNDFLGSGMSFADLVEFSPNEPGIPFDRSFLPDLVEVMEKGGDLVHVDLGGLQNG